MTDRNFQEGLELYSARKYILALDRFTKALLVYPHNREIQKYIVLASQQVMATEADQKRLDPALLRQMVRQAQEALQERRKIMEETLEKLKLASSESQLNDPSAMLKACRGIDIILDVSLGDDSEGALVKYYASSICSNLKKSFDAGIGIDKRYLRMILGYLAYCRSEWAEAMKQWRAALVLEPQNAQLKKLIENAKQHLQRENQAKQIGVLIKASREHIGQHRYPEAMARLESVLNLDPLNEEALKLLEESQKQNESAKNRTIARLVRLAEESQKKGEWIYAARYWLSVLELDPAHPHARNYLTTNKLQILKNTQSLIQNTPVGPIMDEASQNPEKSDQLYTLGLIQYSEGDLAASAKSLRASLKQNFFNTYAQRALKRVENELNYAP